MSWQKKEALLDEEFMAEARAETMQQEREEVHAALHHAASFHRVLGEWKDCEKKSGLLWISMYEMWKRKRIHEDARKMHWTSILSNM